jgi:2,3-bisphosphoglycerate-independent phosphoglycerate mutase
MGMSTPARVLLFFVDGIGVGPADAETNAFAAAELPTMQALSGGVPLTTEGLGTRGEIHCRGALIRSVDACLGVPGRPQSGTGQAALLTGTNAPREFGRHFGSWVPVALRDVVRRESVLGKAARAGRRVAYANAHPPIGDRRPAAPPLAAEGAGLPLRGLEALVAGEVVASSFTNERWRARLGHHIPEVSLERAAERLALAVAASDLTLFAHFDTDFAGHEGRLDLAVDALERLDRFLGFLLAALPPDVTVVLASDHGNLEDAGAGHTRNPVPVVAVGPGHDAFTGVHAITDVAPTILRLLDVEGS